MEQGLVRMFKIEVDMLMGKEGQASWLTPMATEMNARVCAVVYIYIYIYVNLVRHLTPFFPP